MIIREYKDFTKGVINRIEARSIPPGAASDSINWRTMGDKIELTRGMLLVGSENTGNGKITGLHKGATAAGTEILFKTYGQKAKYYDPTTEDWIEIGSDLLGSSADGEDVSFANYVSLAGNMVFMSSPNSSIYKIMTANPGNAIDQYNSTKSRKGYITIKQNRTFLWNRKDNDNFDKTGLYLSYIDDAEGYTDVTAEVLGTGNGSNKTFSGTLTERTGRRHVFGIVVTDGTESFSDDYSGNLTGTAGGTGTINYATGAISVTFNAAVAGAQDVTVDYQYEDQGSGGLTDFTWSGTRLAGEGDLFRQDIGGDLKNVFAIEDLEYCIHESIIYKLTLGLDDTTATNLVFAENTGMPNWWAGVPTGEGVYYIDDSDENDPKIKLLSYGTSNEKVIPEVISASLDLTDYRFNYCQMIEWGDYIVVACRTSNKDNNNRLLVYDRKWKSWDIYERFAHRLAVYNGSLYIGDSGSNNVYEIFSGLDDDESTINNYWIGWKGDLEIDGLKKVKRLILEGEIGADQEIEVFASLDNGTFTSIGTIRGDGSYVDTSQSVNVGAITIGRAEIGGGGGDGAIPAHNYMRELKWRSDKFERVQLKFVANKIGYASVSTIRFKDIRLKGNKIPSKYRTAS